MVKDPKQSVKHLTQNLITMDYRVLKVLVKTPS
jgi:hypothetical protein